jgi:hypothetical protein
MSLATLDAVASFTYQRTAVCFFGHTHVPMVFIRDQGVRQERTEHIRIEPAKSISSTPAASGNHATETGARRIAFTTLKTICRTGALNTIWRPRKRRFPKRVCRSSWPSDWQWAAEDKRNQR